MMKRLITMAVCSLVLLMAGYALAAQQVVMDIQGMTCDLCPIAIKKSLKEVKGVRDIKVSFEEKKAWLTVDDTVTDKTLEEAVRKVGEQYKGKVVGGQPER